jgi:hypothetical protein
MKRAWFSVFTFGFLLLASPANAWFDDGNDLLKYCTSQNMYSQGMCIGSIIAYYDSMSGCSTPAPNITRGQIRDIVVKFLQDHPADRHLSGVTLAYRAFKVAFGCKPKTTN